MGPTLELTGENQIALQAILPGANQPIYGSEIFAGLLLVCLFISRAPVVIVIIKLLLLVQIT